LPAPQVVETSQNRLDIVLFTTASLMKF
jgi:hypothetical protein